MVSKNPFNAHFQQTMLRIKDPKVSVPFYEKHFGMKLVHKYDFPEWKFSVYFLETPRKGAGGEGEEYLNTMTGCTLELTHNHGTEKDDNFKVWNGNTGGDASGDLKADSPKFRGFGHIAFNTADVYKACEELEKNGVKFQKKPDEGRMKGLAFALDPDGYWLEIVKRQSAVFDDVGAEKFNLSQTMLRVKDGNKSVAFYRDVLGMTLLRAMSFGPERGNFSLYFLAHISAEDLARAFKLLPEEEQEDHGEVLDPHKPSSITKVIWQPVLELTYNHGTEKDEAFAVHDGNAEPQGFGHVGFLVDNLDETCDEMVKMGVQFKKMPKDGKMRQIAFVYDPDRYWVELIQRGAKL